MTTPYTYLIHWIDTDMSYYGVRYADGCHPSDLWNPYPTSSSHVEEYIKIHGPPDVSYIDMVFDDEAVDVELRKKAAKLFESEYLREWRAKLSDRWLNKNDGHWDFMHCKPHTEEGRQNMRDAHARRRELGLKRKPFSEESRKKLSEASRKRKGSFRHSDEWKEDARKRNLGKKLSDEHKRKISEAARRQKENPSQAVIEGRKRRADKIRGNVTWLTGKPGHALGSKWTDERRKRFAATIAARKN